MNNFDVLIIVLLAFKDELNNVNLTALQATNDERKGKIKQ